MTGRPSALWKEILRAGLIGGGMTILMALVGMVETFGERDIVSGVISMGQVLALAPMLVFGYTAARRVRDRSPLTVLSLGLLSGLVGGAVVAVLLLIGQWVNLRAMFINASPGLYGLLTLGQALPAGIFIPLLGGLIAGGLGSGVFLAHPRWRSTLIQAGVWVVLVGLLRELLVTMISRWGPVALLFRWLFAQSGLSPIGAIVLFGVVGSIYFLRSGRSARAQASQPPAQQKLIRWAQLAGVALVLIALPPVLGIFLSEVLDNVGLFILMGLGLNIVVGFAGLLDLGYVAFYAIGAYTMGVLTSPELGFFNLTYWQAVLFALGMAVFAGVLLGLPVLKMRGDYLAIVTLGFGEIVRLLALSDWLRPYLGGSQGIQQIARPRIGPLELGTQQQLYYLILAGIAVAAFVAWRLKDSRLGRSWMALREDEDVAGAMGINLVATKLLAFATGAFFAGLSGTIFAAKLTSVYPHSMNFLVSINALCLIIVGGMGSIPGVIVGALFLVGLPELLREFAEFRYLVYGAVLVAMMLTRPEGLWPEERRRLELHEAEVEASPGEVASIPASD